MWILALFNEKVGVLDRITDLECDQAAKPLADASDRFAGRICPK